MPSWSTANMPMTPPTPKLYRQGVSDRKNDSLFFIFLFV
jgi:hypothetical protein